MHLQLASPELADGDYPAYVNGSNMRNGGCGFAVIQLDKRGNVDLTFDEPEELDRLIIAASAAKQMLINARRPHAHRPGLEDGRCLDCGVLRAHHVEPAPADDARRLTAKGAEVAAAAVVGHTTPTCDWRPYPAGSEGDDGTECILPAGHSGSHYDATAVTG